ncbi:penicillin-binding transpeptidase domain-containing protein [Nonomuraea sp. NPDC050536]|uniref:penicillin-binding transpeptidase domain-containing protein n=1 Tax=Nonomuraea sp. NPDC050536 TaxID=3364366 RepID=UPI0037C53D11
MTSNAVAGRVKGSPQQTADAYFRDWGSGDIEGMAGLVYRPPVDFVTQHLSLTEELHVESIELRPGALRKTGENTAEVPFSGTRRLREFGAWPFSSTLRLAVRDRAWKVLWAPETLHPLLKGGGTLDLTHFDGPSTELVTAEGDKIPENSYADSYLRMIQPHVAKVHRGWALVSNVPGKPAQQLMTVQPDADKKKTTLSRAVQAAAARALDGVDDAAVVAVRPSTGELLAVADRLTGNYSALFDAFPPGSTFKTITAAALLKSGLDPAETMDCPGTYTIPFHRSFKNAGETAHGQVSFADAYAYSCNTSFVEQTVARIGAQDLIDTAREWGFDKGMPTGAGTAACGTMQPTDDVDMLGQDAIGQGSVQASPACMAAIAAAAEDGTWRPVRMLPPKDVTRIDGPLPEPVKLDDGVLTALRGMMAAVVDHGTAAGAGLPAGVAGKTGTAEAADGGEHGWFIGYRGDLAFCVFVRHGGSGRAAALPIAVRFLAGL